jgi:K+ transporter
LGNFLPNDVNIQHAWNPRYDPNCATSRGFKAINPYYAYQLLRIHPDGFFVLGFVFCVQLELKRCILTWDIAVENIRISWIL